MSTPTRELGGSGITVSAVGVGGWAMGGKDWGGGADDGESVHALRRALDLGVNLFDTADLYGLGRSERVLGEALRGRREQAVIATKFGNVFDEEKQEFHGVVDASPDYIRHACDASLRRLDTDYIDLYQLHHGDFGPEGAEEAREALEGLVAAGKIRAYGWSTDSPERAAIFAKGPHCAAVQCHLNVLEDNPAMMDFCRTHKLAAINRVPLAFGLLTGKYGPEARFGADDLRGPQAADWMVHFRDGRPNPESLARLAAITEILRSDGRTTAQGALAWCWARYDGNLPIPGFRSPFQIEENCGALQFGPLTAEQMTEIDQLLGR